MRRAINNSIGVMTKDIKQSKEQASYEEVSLTKICAKKNVNKYCSFKVTNKRHRHRDSFNLNHYTTILPRGAHEKLDAGPNLLREPPIIGLRIHCDLHTQILRCGRGINGISSLLLISHAILIIISMGPISVLTFAKRNSIGSGMLLRVNGKNGAGSDVAWTWAGDDVGGSSGAGRVRGGGDGEGASVVEGAANREDDAEGHGGGENGGHAGNDGLDGIVDACWVHDEPEEHVNHVDEPDSAIEVEAIAEHEFPISDGLDLERLERTCNRKDEGGRIEESSRQPIEANPVVFGACNATLSYLKRCGAVEATANGSNDDLNSEQGTHTSEDRSALFVNCMDTDDMDC
jgi:hypothetical protein